MQSNIPGSSSVPGPSGPPGTHGAPGAPSVPYYSAPPTAPPPGPPQVFQMPPIFNEMLLDIRDANAMLRASIDQQQDLVRYTQDLNHWFGRDRHERKRDVRRILDSIEDLRRAVPPGGLQGVSVPVASTTVRTGTSRPAVVIPSPEPSRTGERIPRAQTPYPHGTRPPVIPSSEISP
ncbi:unnamed protein product [Peniophora sp. CBMAI 1063]|nr:unnamed protein product [Peniophora sp. CBMAI 1063]